MTTLRTSERASREIKEIYDYIAHDNTLAAEAVVDRIYEAIGNLLSNPRMGHETLTRGLRMFVVSPYPYLIFYRYRPRLDELHVERVRHAARRRPALREDAPEFRAAANS